MLFIFSLGKKTTLYFFDILFLFLYLQTYFSKENNQTCYPSNLMRFILFILFLFSLPVYGEVPSWNQPQEQPLYIPQSPSPTQSWHRISNSHVDVFFAGKDFHTAKSLARHAAEEIPKIAKNIGLPSGGPMKIYIAPNQKLFSDLQPHGPPDWADGTAWPQHGLIFLRSPSIRDGRSDSLEQVLEHEIVHILLGRAFGKRPVPRWLQEGVAQIIAKEYSNQDIEQIAQGVLGESLLSLRELSFGFPSNPTRARLAYAQSADFVAFLYERFGSSSLRIVIKQMSKGKNFDDALYNATGKTVDQLDTMWRGTHQDSWLWLQPLLSDVALMAFGGIALFVGFFLRSNRRKEIPVEWVDDEAIQNALEKELKNWHPAPTNIWYYPAQ